MLYDAKYIFYSDMLAFKVFGMSLTGGHYAVLPHGPQLNNYSELVDYIRTANLSEADPLTREEKLVINRVAMTFPQKRMAYNASHRKVVIKEKLIGQSIPYTDAFRLTEI